MSKVAELRMAVFLDESIEDITPLDLTGASDSDRMEILYIYSKYGKDPERKKICEQKLKEERIHAAGRHCV